MPGSNRRRVVGVMGGARASPELAVMSEELGRLIAQAGLVLLTGGRPSGVMDAASRGAHEAGGLVVGVLPGADPDDVSAYVDVAIATNFGDARNLINVLSSDVVVACPGGAGTLSEVALAVKNAKPVVLLNFDPGPVVEPDERAGRVLRATTPTEAMDLVHKLLDPPGSARPCTPSTRVL